VSGAAGGRLTADSLRLEAQLRMNLEARYDLERSGGGRAERLEREVNPHHLSVSAASSRQLAASRGART
jgi:hypothetical protein